MDKLTENYFQILEDHFSLIHNVMSGTKNDAEKIALILKIYPPKTQETMLESLYEDLVSLDWSSRKITVHKSPGIKSSFSDFLSSNNLENTKRFLRRIALYSDTILLDDPILTELITLKNRQKTQTNTSDLSLTLSFFIISKVSENMLKIRNLFFSDEEIPICFLTPSQMWTLNDEKLHDKADNLVKENALALASDVIGKNFSSIGSLTKYLKMTSDLNTFILGLKNPQMLTDKNGLQLSSEYVKKAQIFIENRWSYKPAMSDILIQYFHSRLVNPIFNLMANAKFSNNLATDSKGAHETFLWMLKKDNLLFLNNDKKKSFSKQTLIVNALNQEKLKFIGDIPIDKIKNIRERGELGDLRKLISDNIEDLGNSNDEDLESVANQVEYNIFQAMKKHQAEIKDLDEKYRTKYKIYSASLITLGSLGIISSIYPPIPYIVSLFGGAGLISKTIWEYFEKRDQRKILKKRPIGIFFDTLQN